MAAGHGNPLGQAPSPSKGPVFELDKFWEDYNASTDPYTPPYSLIDNVFMSLPSGWTKGVKRSVRTQSIPSAVGGKGLLFSVTIENLAAEVRVYLNEGGKLVYEVKNINGNLAQTLTGKRGSPWADESIKTMILEIVKPYAVDPVKAQAEESGRNLKPLAETSKVLAPNEKALPVRAESLIASYLSGLPESAGTPQQQMNALKGQSGRPLSSSSATGSKGQGPGGRRRKTRTRASRRTSLGRKTRRR